MFKYGILPESGGRGIYSRWNNTERKNKKWGTSGEQMALDFDPRGFVRIAFLRKPTFEDPKSFHGM